MGFGERASRYRGKRAHSAHRLRHRHGTRVLLVSATCVECRLDAAPADLDRSVATRAVTSFERNSSALAAGRHDAATTHVACWSFHLICCTGLAWYSNSPMLVSDKRPFYRATHSGLRVVAQRMPTTCLSGPDVGPRRRAFHCHPATADPIGLMLRDADAPRAGTFGALTVFEAHGPDGAFRGNWHRPRAGRDRRNRAAGGASPCRTNQRRRRKDGTRER